MTAPAGWEGLLDEGETILWQGRPDAGVTIRPGNVMLLLFGLIFAGFALFWMVMAAQAGGGFWMFGLIHFSVGLGIVFAALFWAPFRRRGTWYTLTDRRAFIATDLPLMGKRLKSYPIDADSMLELADGPLATVNFAQELKRGKNGHYRVPVGFERIADGKTVYRLMREIQSADRENRDTERN